MRQTHDYIVVGGGSGGCVMAGRLSEDPDTTVCLLEAGGGGNSPIINTPAGAVGMLPTKVNNWAFETVPQPGLNGRRGYQPRGKALGGSSAINAMVYTRGHKVDYDHWAALGNTGWSYDEILPYFRLSEHNERIDNEYHGRGGPLWVSDPRSDNPFQHHFVQAAKEAGLPVSTDFNGAEQEGLGVFQVTQKHGERWSAARAYVLPHMGRRDNLSVVTHAMVQRILFKEKRAIGVEVDVNGVRQQFFARREVILAAGAFQTPQLLMCSGVGDSAELNALGIPVIAHLPGVGKNLQDHPDFIFGYKSNNTDLMGVSAKGSLKMAGHAWKYATQRRGMLATNFAECGGFLKTSPDLEAPDIQLHFVIALVDNHARTFHFDHGLSCHVCLLRPKSRGKVSIQAKSMYAQPLIDPAFLKEEEDLEDMVKGFKLTRHLMGQPSLARHIIQDPFTADVYSDDEIREVLRNRTDTVYHPVGTCRMGKDPMGVVDETLQVRSLLGLRIVDCSVMPTVPGGNTNAPAIMVAEKAVDMIRGFSRADLLSQESFATSASSKVKPKSAQKAKAESIESAHAKSKDQPQTPLTDKQTNEELAS